MDGRRGGGHWACCLTLDWQGHAGFPEFGRLEGARLDRLLMTRKGSHPHVLRVFVQYSGERLDLFLV